MSRWDDEGRTAFHIAVEGDRRDAVELLLQKGADPNAQDKHGGTALWHAAYYASSPASLPLLLGQGAKVIDFAQNDPSLPTALWAAAAANKLDVAELLLENGANPNVPDEQGSTLLHKTDWPAATAIASLLLRYGASISIANNQGKRPLHCAAGTYRSNHQQKQQRPTEKNKNNDNKNKTALIM